MEMLAETATRAVVIAEETLAQWWDEAQPLAREHWREIASFLDIPLAPNRAFYERVEAAGQLCLLSARADQRLVGYALFIVVPPPHYANSLQAQQDVFYVEPSARGALIGLRLIAAADEILTARGVQVVYHHVKLKHPTLGRLLERKGYHATETFYAKRLDGR
jgi:GNAT superfamily N-acetyltransferase